MINKDDQMTLLKVKSLLNHIRYFLKEEDLKIVDDFHRLCRKFVSWGGNEQEKKA